MTIILFYISLLVIFGLIASKVFEIKVRKIHSLSNMFMRGDEQIHKLIELAVFKYNRYRKIIHIFIFEFIPSYVYELLVRMKDYVSKKYYSTGDSFRGRRILRSNGSISYFLERLGDDKTHTEVRKI